MTTTTHNLYTQTVRGRELSVIHKRHLANTWAESRARLDAATIGERMLNVPQFGPAAAGDLMGHLGVWFATLTGAEFDALRDWARGGYGK